MACLSGCLVLAGRLCVVSAIWLAATGPFWVSLLAGCLSVWIVLSILSGCLDFAIVILTVVSLNPGTLIRDRYLFPMNFWPVNVMKS